MLEKRFIKASIRHTAGAWKLSATYSYYSLYEFTDVFIYSSLQECKERLILERTHGRIEIIGEKNEAIKIEVGDG
jgi:hypothetical protein